MAQTLLVVGGILLYFAILGEYKINTYSIGLTKKYRENTLVNLKNKESHCNNYIHTQNYLNAVGRPSTIQWRRAIIIAMGSTMISYFLIKKLSLLDSTDKALLIFISFVVNWGVAGYTDYHLRSVINQNIITTMQNTASSFGTCTIFATNEFESL